MIPVSLVNLNQNDIILDSCAAPGSKTLQIMEYCFSQAHELGFLPKGVIWANDECQKRAQMLIHLLQNHPTSNLTITCSDASKIPMNKNLQPDMIFCDVPCSGDGTVRKTKQIKKSWDLRHSYQKHDLQKSILENCVNICKVGGKIVYSTCAINPIENEAVVASVLEKYKDVLEIEDISENLDSVNIKYCNGLTKWKVYLDSKLLVNCNKFEEISETRENLKKENKFFFNKTNVVESMFHPIYTNQNFKTGKLYVSKIQNK